MSRWLKSPRVKDLPRLRGSNPVDHLSRRIVRRCPRNRGERGDPSPRDGLPEDCVGAVLLFVSEAGSFITGQILEINGGMAMP